MFANEQNDRKMLTCFITYFYIYNQIAVCAGYGVYREAFEDMIVDSKTNIVFKEKSNITESFI